MHWSYISFALSPWHDIWVTVAMNDFYFVTTEVTYPWFSSATESLVTIRGELVPCDQKIIIHDNSYTETQEL